MTGRIYYLNSKIKQQIPITNNILSTKYDTLCPFKVAQQATLKTVFHPGSMVISAFMQCTQPKAHITMC